MNGYGIDAAEICNSVMLPVTGRVNAGANRQASVKARASFFMRHASAEIMSPSGQDLDDVHQAYVAMATSGVVTEAQRLVFNIVSQKLLKEKGAEAIMLGGTDLALAFNQQDSAFPLVDCAGIHVDAIVRLAIS